VIVVVLTAPTNWPVTIPEAEPIVAVVTVLLAHVPPEVVSDKVVVVPAQITKVPNIGDGSGSIVTTVEVIQPVAVNVYIIVVVSAVTPPTKVPAVIFPVVGFTLAVVGEMLLHVPPPVASDKVVDAPEHSISEPVIAVGLGLTVRTAVMIQPVLFNVYVIVAVPAVNTVPAVTSPVNEPIVAMVVALMLHVPPPVGSLKCVVNPEHTLKVPAILAGNGLIVTIAVVIQPVGKV
jgi:hypothetical protein